MTFDDISGDGSLWAVRYDGADKNILEITFDRWNDLDGFYDLTNKPI